MNLTASETFEKWVIRGKGGFILLLLLFSLINGQTSYVKDNPRKFIGDSVSTGVFGGLAGVFLAYTRGRPDLAMNHFIFGLLFFFLYSVTREFSGYFTVLGNEPKTGNENTEIKILKWPLLILGILILLYMSYLAFFRARIAADFSTGMFRNLPQTPAFILETLMFSSIITIGEIIVASNHGDPVGAAAISSLVMFSFAHVILQKGGFYSHLYHPITNI